MPVKQVIKLANFIEICMNSVVNLLKKHISTCFWCRTSTDPFFSKSAHEVFLSVQNLINFSLHKGEQSYGGGAESPSPSV